MIFFNTSHTSDSFKSLSPHLFSFNTWMIGAIILQFFMHKLKYKDSWRNKQGIVRNKVDGKINYHFVPEVSVLLSNLFGNRWGGGVIFMTLSRDQAHKINLKIKRRITITSKKIIIRSAMINLPHSLWYFFVSIFINLKNRYFWKIFPQRDCRKCTTSISNQNFIRVIFYETGKQNA